MADTSKNLILVLDNVRSALNVGAIFRSADAFGVAKIYCCGITPYPRLEDDSRLPHIAHKADRMIAKAALGAESTVPFGYDASAPRIVESLRAEDMYIYALEQAGDSIDFREFKPAYPCALIVGSEVDGVDQRLLQTCDAAVEIAMHGTKESLNVAVATGIALYHFSV